MELFDYLTEEDKITIKEFIQAYTGIKNVDLALALKYWNKNKKKMFKVLGKKLRVKIPVNIPCDNKTFIHTLSEIYYPPFSFYKDRDNHPFLEDYEQFANDLWDKRGIDKSWPQASMREMFRYDNIKNGTLHKDYTFSRGDINKKLKIPEGTKIMRAVQKTLKFIDYPRMDLFEQWRNDVSNLTTTKCIKTNLVFSIHPIDFLTMSDNACGWRSCMSWVDNGGYSTGPIEMMNSNMVIIAYLESSKKFQFNMHDIPNKSWRVLFYVHKNILLEGKSYPYYNETIAKVALDNLKDLVYNNIGWTYQYGAQQYFDLCRIHSNGYVRSTYPRTYSSKSHNIYIYTNGMYNDLIKDHNSVYWCYRNWVPRDIFINASGVANCMNCGKPIEYQSEINSTYDDEDLRVYGSCKVCPDCNFTKRCHSCDTIYDEPMITIKEVNRSTWTRYFHIHNFTDICRGCLKDMFYFKTNDSILHSSRYDELWSQCCLYKNEYYFIPSNEVRDFRDKCPYIKLKRVGEDVDRIIQDLYSF